MAKKRGDGEDATGYKAVFVDTNLNTHLAIPVSSADTIFDLKRKILTEHSKCFQEFGQIEVHALKVKCKEKLYSLSDLMPVTTLFSGNAKLFLVADISGQFCRYEAADYKTMFLTDPKPRILFAGPSLASQLQRGYEKNERIFQTDNLSGEARSENLQLVVGFRNDDSLKSSSSDTDKRLNALVEDIYRANCGKDKNSNGLVTEVTSVSPVKKLDIVSLEKNKPKKKRKVAAHDHSFNGNNAVEIGSTDKDLASHNLEIMKNLDQNVTDREHCDHADTGVGTADPNKREDKSSETSHFKSSSSEWKNGAGAEIEQTVDPHSEGKKGVESHGRDMKDVPIGSDKTKRITKKKNKRMTKLEVMNDDTLADIDASANVSAKSPAAPLDVQFRGSEISEAYQSTFPDKATVSDSGTSEKVVVKNVSMHVQCNKSTGSAINMDEVGTEELGRVESVPDVKDSEKEGITHGITLQSGMKRSKKRKNSGGDVSHQMDIKGNEELGVPDIGDMEKGTKMLAESGTTRPFKRKKTGDDLPDVIKMDRVGDEKSGMLSSKQQNQTQKAKKKIKQKQTPPVKNVAESGMRHQSDTMEPEKSKFTLPKSAAGEDDNIGTLSSTRKEMDKVFPLVTSEADIEMSTKVGVDEVLITNNESDVKPQQGADETIRNDAEPMQLTQIQKSVEGAEVTNKRSSKKTNISEFSVKDKKNNMKRDRSKSAFSKSTAQNNDDMEFLTSFQERVDQAGSMVDYDADIEMKNGKSGVDDIVFVTNHGSEISPPKEAVETMQYDAEPKLLTRIQKREKDNGSKSEKSKKKNKQKPHPLKNISDFSVVDQSNSIKLGGRKSTLSRSEVEKDEIETLSSPVEKIDNVSLISASQADAEISTKTQVDEVIMTNLGRDVNLQQEEDDTCQNDVEPIQLTQVQKGRCDTENKSVQPKKKTKQQQTRSGKSLPKVVKGDQGDSRNDNSLDKDLEVARAEVSLNAAKDKGSEKTSSGSKHLRKSTDLVQQERSVDFSSEKTQNATDSIKFKVEGSTLVGKSVDAEQQDRSISSAEQHAADIMKSKVESSSLKTKGSGSLLNGISSRTSSSHSDILNKRSHQRKTMKELPKMKQQQSSLRKSSDKSTKKVVQNSSKKNSLISKCSSFFKDESSSSSEGKGGGDASNSSTETPNDEQVSSSDYSEDESRGSWASPKHGNSKNGGSTSYSKSMQKNLTMESILRSSHKYKKAKLIASQLQLEEDESQAIDVVPDSQVKT